jgi:hypothetical protein
MRNSDIAISDSNKKPRVAVQQASAKMLLVQSRMVAEFRETARF